MFNYKLTVCNVNLSITGLKMNYYTRKIIIGQGFIFLLLVSSFASMLMGYSGCFMPDMEMSSIWFQRSGSIAVILSIFAELFFIKESSGLLNNSEIEAKNKFKTLIIITNILSFVLIVLGTFVWGYGDLIYIHLQN